MSFHQKNKVGAFWTAAGIERIIRDVAFRRQTPTEGWVTSSNASPGKKPTDVKESMRSSPSVLNEEGFGNISKV